MKMVYLSIFLRSLISLNTVLYFSVYSFTYFRKFNKILLKFAGVVKLKNLQWESILDFLGGPNVSMQTLSRRKKEYQSLKRYHHGSNVRVVWGHEPRNALSAVKAIYWFLSNSYIFSSKSYIWRCKLYHFNLVIYFLDLGWIIFILKFIFNHLNILVTYGCILLSVLFSFGPVSSYA